MSRECFARSTDVLSPFWSASSVISTSPKTRCRRRSRSRASAGRKPACRRARPGGSSRPLATARSTGCAASPRARSATGKLIAAHQRRIGGEPEGPVRDDRLRLIFTCCHPALGRPAQVALTLRLLGGLQTRDRPRVPREREHDGAAAGARQGQDSRRADPVPGPPRPTCPIGSAPCWRSST